MLEVILRIGGGIGGLTAVRAINYSFPVGSTLSDALIKFSNEISEEILDPTVIVVVNGVLIMEKDRGKYVLKEKDTISIVPGIAGG